jgi:predicted nucleic acid-binding protein
VILADVNVLIHAFRKDSSDHQVCKPWLDRVVRGEARFGVSSGVLSAVVRITTNRRAFAHPSAIDEAFGFCERICLEAGVRGPRVTDAWFAALAIEHGCTWITYDRDYARFPGLDWREPAL